MQKAVGLEEVFLLQGLMPGAQDLIVGILCKCCSKHINLSEEMFAVS